MPKIKISVEVDSYEEAARFLDGRITPPVEPPVEPPVVEPPVVEPPEPALEEMDPKEVPVQVDKAFDTTRQDLVDFMPLKIKLSDLVALKLEKIPGWTWRKVSSQNIMVLLTIGAFKIIKCFSSNTEASIKFEMHNGEGVIGAEVEVTFAIVN